jgi:hypothetical protein
MEGDDRAKPGTRFGALVLISAVDREKKASMALKPQAAWISRKRHSTGVRKALSITR